MLKHRAAPDHTTTPDPATWPDETIPPLVLTFKVRASNGLPLFKIPILTPDMEQSASCHNWRDHDRGLKPFGRANVSGAVTVRLVDGIPGKERESALWAWITRGKPPTRDQMHRIDTHYAQR